MNDVERPDSQESPPDNFGVDFNCDINTLYGRLTEKPSRTHCNLSSNWKDISDAGDYDFFSDISVYLGSALKILSSPEIEDRNSRTVGASATFKNTDRSSWETRVAEVISESTKLGIDLSILDDPDPKKSDLFRKVWLVPQNPELKWAILLKTLTYDARFNYIDLKYPFRGNLDLEGHQTVQNILQNMSSAIEHILRVCYAIEGKILPEKRLIFFPKVEPGEAKEVSAFAKCSYCGSGYPKSEVKCPSCGA